MLGTSPVNCVLCLLCRSGRGRNHWRILSRENKAKRKRYVGRDKDGRPVAWPLDSGNNDGGYAVLLPFLPLSQYSLRLPKTDDEHPPPFLFSLPPRRNWRTNGRTGRWLCGGREREEKQFHGWQEVRKKSEGGGRWAGAEACPAGGEGEGERLRRARNG